MASNIRSKEALLQDSLRVRNEQQEGANTAQRIGTLFYNITEHIQDVAITPKRSTGTEIAEFSINGQTGHLFAPDGGGGEPGEQGYQKTYFTNAKKTDTVSAPLSSQYQSDTFVDNRVNPARVWTNQNHNPAVDEFTYAIWVYFSSNGSIITIDGPVNMMNGGGTNGEDGEEIEWAYIRFDHELSPSDISLLRDYLSQCKVGGTHYDQAHKWDPNTSQYVSCTFGDADAVPVNWEDNAQGIDEQGHQYEYAAFRKSKNDTNGNRTWGDDCFHGPLLWSAYGKQGMDGDGVEYIFYADSGGAAPVGNINRPETWTNDEDFQEPEYIRTGSDWVDEPIDLDSVEYGPGSKQWVSMRKKRSVGGAEPSWQAYSAPALWSGVGADGVVNGYTISSNNPTMLVTTDSTGKVDSFTDSNTYEVFHNGVRVDYTDDPSQSSTHYMLTVGTISRSDGGATTGISAAPASSGRIVVTLSNVLNLDSVNIAIPVVVSLPDGTTRNSKITVAGLAASEGGYAVSLYVASSVIRTDYYEQNVVPASLNIGVRIGKGDNPTVYYSGQGAEDRGYMFKYTYDNSGVHTPVLGPITISTRKSNITVELFKDGTFLESLTLPYVKDGAPGIGIAAVNYSMCVLSTSVAVQDSTVGGQILFKVLKTTGSSTQEITTSPFNGSGGDGETIHANINGNIRAISYDSSAGNWVASYSGTYNSSYPFSQIYVESATSALLASVTVPIIKNGDSAVQGLDAVVMRFRSYQAIASGYENPWYGDIQNGTTPYTDGVIYKDIILFDGPSGDNSYYYVAPTNQESRGPQWATNNPPANASTGEVNPKWVHFIEMGDGAFQALLAKYAYIENLTAAEIVITNANQQPIAGMTRGTGTGIYPSGRNPIADNKRGDVRIWAGYSGGTANLYDSKFYVTEAGFVHIEDADIKNTLRYHKLMKSTPSASAINLFNIVDNKLELLCDTFLLYGTYSSNAVIQLPPASFFAGAGIRIINGTYRSNSGHLDGDPSIVTLEVYHSSNTEPSYEDSQLVSMNSLAIATPFTFAGSSGQAYYDYYTTISFDSYTSVELIAAENWYQGVSNPYYVWMVVDAR